MSDEVESLDYWLPLAEQGDAAACYNVGVIFQEADNISKAIQYYEKAITLNPMFAEAYNNLGGIYKLKDEPEMALDYYYKALHLMPELANINNNIGVIQQNQKNFKDALRFFNKALYLDPNCATAHYNMGLIHEDQTLFTKAAEYYEKAYKLDPTLAVPFYWSGQMVIIQDLYLNQKNQKAAIEKMKALSQWAVDNKVLGEKVVGFSAPFYITYQEYNNRDIFCVYGDICVSLMSYLQKNIITNKKSNKKIRIGIVSDTLHGHSVWFAVLKGWYQHLDKSRFEIYSFSLGKKQDAEKEFARQQSDYFVEGSYDTAQWRDLILEQQPDVLIFPAIGMDWKIQQLASLRMAPIQMTSWGHPETSGLPTIDYYLSGDDFEPACAQDNYREKLIKLPNLGSCYEPLALCDDEFNIAEFGINPDTCLLVVPGTPFKFEKQYDYVFAEIASRIKNSKMIFFRSKPDGLTEAFERRIRQAFNDKQLVVEEHAIFITAMRKSRFHALLRQAHIYLDSIGFSGFNTAMQGIECGLPIVTYEGKFMRGRFASAILRKMDLEELVAVSTQSYIEKAVQLANDQPYRQTIRNKIEQKSTILYSDETVIKKLEDFILTVAK